MQDCSNDYLVNIPLLLTRIRHYPIPLFRCFVIILACLHTHAYPLHKAHLSLFFAHIIRF